MVLKLDSEGLQKDNRWYTLKVSSIKGCHNNPHMLLIRVRSRIYTDTVSSLSAGSLASACLLCYNGKGLFNYMRPFTVNMLQRPCSSLIGWQLGNIPSLLVFSLSTLCLLFGINSDHMTEFYKSTTNNQVNAK